MVISGGGKREKSTLLCGVNQFRLISCVFMVVCLLISLTMYLNNSGISLVQVRLTALNRASNQTTSPSHHLIEASTRPPECTPAQRIVYLKTHKTAGTTLATIFQRFGFTRNLTFAIPAEATPVFNCCRYFKRTDVFRYEQIGKSALERSTAGVNSVNKTFDLMTSHAVYLRPEIDAVVADALYVTSIRDPVDQFESAFVYFDMPKQAGLQAAKNPIATFFTNPQEYKKKIRYGGKQVQNGQLFDLGLSTKLFSDAFYVKYKIRQLDNEFDLVIVKEYFDESLILMKKLFCWDVDDILYIPKRIANFRFNISRNLRQEIRKWNSADMLLYEHFNRTFWRKIDEYGADFWRELAVFRRRIKEVSSICEVDSQIDSDSKHHLSILKSTNNSEFCQNLYRFDGDYVKLIRQRMLESNYSKTDTAIKVQTGIPVKKKSKPNLGTRIGNIRKQVTNKRVSKTNVSVKKTPSARRPVKKIKHKIPIK